MKLVNQFAAGGVWHSGKAMDALAASCTEIVVDGDASLEREFQERLAECATLAFRVALAILRDRAEAEDVAQEALPPDTSVEASSVRTGPQHSLAHLPVAKIKKYHT